MISKADQKRRITLPRAEPGDVYDIQCVAEGRYHLVKLVQPNALKTSSRTEVLRRLDERPLAPALSWKELKRLTREP